MRKSSLRREYRDLRTGHSVWEEHGRPAIRRLRLKRLVEADVLIIGAGISGALTAYLLTEAGKRVAIVDRRGFARGSTVVSTALLQFELDTPLTVLIEKIGRKYAERAWLRSAKSVSDLAHLVERSGIACGWSWRDALYLAGDRMKAHDLQRETAARRRIGIQSKFIEAAELRSTYGIDREGAIRSSGVAEADPLRLTTGLIRRAAARGACFYHRIQVNDLRPAGARVAARTRCGSTIRAQYVVLATGYETFPRVPSTDHKIVSTWAMATGPQSEKLWPSRSLIWEAASPYVYARTTTDGRVIIGGEDEDISDEAKRDALNADKVKQLQRKLHDLFPDLDVEPEFAWSGTFGDSETGLPTIGPVPGMPRCFAVRGFGGNGITFSMIAAQLIRGHICGPRDPDRDLFKFAPRWSRR